MQQIPFLRYPLLLKYWQEKYGLWHIAVRAAGVSMHKQKREHILKNIDNQYI